MSKKRKRRDFADEFKNDAVKPVIERGKFLPAACEIQLPARETGLRTQEELAAGRTPPPKQRPPLTPRPSSTHAGDLSTGPDSANRTAARNRNVPRLPSWLPMASPGPLPSMAEAAKRFCAAVAAPGEGQPDDSFHSGSGRSSSAGSASVLWV